MEQTELERLIGELELALDRLRSLYEQYFVGIEKIVPAVPRKDVDRKLHALRKEQIRNTALRFRFQMVLQRYNTYQTHWQRVCREIENGTYKRHMVRAQRRFGSTRPPPRGTAPPIVRPEPGDALPGDLVAQLAERDRDFEAPSFDIDIPIDVDQPSSRRPSPTGGAPGRRLRPPSTPAAAPVVPVAASIGPRCPSVPPHPRKKVPGVSTADDSKRPAWRSRLEEGCSPPPAASRALRARSAPGVSAGPPPPVPLARPWAPPPRPRSRPPRAPGGPARLPRRPVAPVARPAGRPALARRAAPAKRGCARSMPNTST